jgi:hypothetical protein
MILAVLCLFVALRAGPVYQGRTGLGGRPKTADALVQGFDPLFT